MIAVRRTLSPLVRWRRPAWFRKLAALALAAFALNYVLQAAVAAAIALAPNVYSSPVPDMPARLSVRGAVPLRVPLAGADGELAAWRLEPATGAAKATIVLLHGVRMDKSSLAPLALALADAGYRAVLVDLRGHGASDGNYLTYGVADARDISRLLDALREPDKALGQVGIYGFSYGAAVAIDVAARDARVGSVVAVAPFSSLREVMGDYRRKYLPEILQLVPDAWFQQALDRAGWLAGFDADAAAPLKNIAEGGAAVLLVHGDADTQVPLRHSQRLALAGAERSELFVLRGATHAAMPVDASGAIQRRALAWFDDSFASPR